MKTPLKPVAACFLLTLLLGLCAPPARGADPDPLQQLLSRLGLVDLQIAHLERLLADPDTTAETEQRARELADLYATRLMDTAEDKTRYDDTMSRIRDLLERFPEANTSALQVMLLQADYNRAETQIAAWIADPQKTDAQQDARQILQRIVPQLDRYQQQLNEQVEQILERMDTLPEGDAMQTAEQQWRRTQQLAVRATYFAAWSHFYLATVTGAPSGSDDYQQARQTFRKLLGLQEVDLADVRSPELGLESVWRARALTGLGLSEAACGNAAASDAAFALLEDLRVPPEIKEQVPYWYLRALTHAGRWQKAVDFARQHVRGFNSAATQGQVSFCAALVRIGYTAPNELSAEARGPAGELGKLGLAGLARLDQFAALEKLIEKYDVPVDAQSGFVLLWAQGQRQFAAAEASEDPAAYERARQTLESALASSDAGMLAGPAARCRYTLGWCHYRLQQDAEAASEFNKAVADLKTVADPLAPEAAWMTFVAYRRLAKSQPRFGKAAADALKRLARDFPDHPYAARVELELARLPGAGSPAETIERLEDVAPDDPNYLESRYELCLLWHRRWSAAKDDPQQSRPYFQALQRAVETFISNAAADAARRVKCCLLAIEAAQHPTIDRADVADSLLAQAEPWASRLPADSPLAAEYHYRALQSATARNDAAARQTHARWLTEHAADSPYEMAALIVVAKHLDEAVQQADGARSEAAAEQAYAIYKRLVALLGDSPTTLESEKNARVAVSRLAFYAARLDRPAEAAELLDRLLTVSPRNRQYLRRAGLAELRAGRPERALPHWRTLLAGLPNGSDAWYEAKYYQLKCLAETDKQQAARVFDQFQLLYPGLGGSAWNDRFTELGNQW